MCAATSSPLTGRRYCAASCRHNAVILICPPVPGCDQSGERQRSQGKTDPASVGSLCTRTQGPIDLLLITFRLKCSANFGYIMLYSACTGHKLYFPITKNVFLDVHMCTALPIHTTIFHSVHAANNMLECREDLPGLCSVLSEYFWGGVE